MCIIILIILSWSVRIRCGFWYPWEGATKAMSRLCEWVYLREWAYLKEKPIVGNLLYYAGENREGGEVGKGDARSTSIFYKCQTPGITSSHRQHSCFSNKLSFAPHRHLAKICSSSQTCPWAPSEQRHQLKGTTRSYCDINPYSLATQSTALTGVHLWMTIPELGPLEEQASYRSYPTNTPAHAKLL